MSQDTNTSKSNWGQRSRRRQELPKDWPQIRAAILARDKGRCVLCGNPANQVDHIGDRNDHRQDNLRALCAPCHQQRTSRQGGQARRKPRRKTPNPKMRTYQQEKHPGLL